MTGSGAPSQAVLDAALRLLAQRLRGARELRNRLLRKGFPTEEVTGCLTWLEDRGYLDDEAFSMALVRDRFKFSPRSPSQIGRELTRRGIAPAVADKALKRVQEEEGTSEAHLAEEAARAWIRKQGPRPLKELLEDRFTPQRERARRRLYGFLARRGFKGEAAKTGMDAGEMEARNILSTKG